MGSRIRASAAKVKTGCSTCKRRHVKCDETKPTCRRCRKAGRQCGGYAQPAPRNIHNNHVSAITVYVPRVQDMTTNNYSFFDNSREFQAFEYFRRRTAPCFFSDFSSIVIPRMVHSEPAVRHAVISLGSLHRIFERGQGEEAGSSAEAQFALQHYGKAMARLRDLPGESNDRKTEVLLMNCILFTSIEILRGHSDSALRNSIAGLKLFGEWTAPQPASSAAHNELRKSIRAMYLRLQNQLMEMTEDCVLPMPLEQCDLPPSMSLSVYFRLNSPEDFFGAFDSLVNRSHYCVLVKDDPQKYLSGYKQRCSEKYGTGPPDGADVYTEIGRIADHVKAFSTALNRFIARHERASAAASADSDKEVLAPPDNMLRLLQIWSLVLSVNMSVQNSKSEARWDAHTEDFRKATYLAEQLFYSTHSNENTSGLPAWDRPFNPNNFPAIAGKPIFSFYMGIITPLWLISTRCREPCIRRRALHLLSICHRREGLWVSDHAASVAKKLIAKEEGGEPEFPGVWDSRFEPEVALDDNGVLFPPEERRWSELKVTFHDHGHLQAQMW